jgi:hypothetical protein
MPSDQPIQTASASAIAEQFKQDLDAFEACERQLLAEERKDRAALLSARFAGLNLAIRC